MKALLLDAANKTATLSDIPIPQPGPNELLIAVKAIALNPVDAIYTLTNPLGSTGRIIGSDFAGLVVARGPLVTQDDYSPVSSSSFAARATNGSGGGGGSASSSGPRRPSTTHSAGISRGDRVAGVLQGACSANDRPGAFAEYVVCPADLVWRVPAHVPLEAAAGVGLCGLAAAQGVFFRLGLAAPFPWDDDSDEGVLRRVESETAANGGGGLRGGDGYDVVGGDDDGDGDGDEDGDLCFLVYGAGTSVGMYVAQLVRRSAEVAGRGVKLIGLASPRHFERLRAEPYRYDHLVDYHDPGWPEKVRQASSGGAGAGAGVHYAYDAVSEASTVRDVSSTLRRGGKVAVVRSRGEPGAWAADGVTTEPVYGAVWEGLGEDVYYDNETVVRSSAAKRAFASAFYKWLSDGGLLHPNPTRVMPGGLERVVEEGFALLGGAGVSNREAGSRGRKEEYMRPISGEKIVYLVETDRTGSAGEGHFA